MEFGAFTGILLSTLMTVALWVAILYIISKINAILQQVKELREEVQELRTWVEHPGEGRGKEERSEVAGGR